MLLVHNVLGAPARGLLWVFREVHTAAEQSLRDEYQAITAELSKLYTLLESGAINETEFDTRERKWLDRMDELEEQGYGAQGDDDND